MVKDAWTLSDVDVYEHGELADRNPAAYAVIEAACQAHGKGMQSYHGSSGACLGGVAVTRFCSSPISWWRLLLSLQSP